MEDFEERVYNILESAWRRMEAAHNSSERDKVEAANQKVLEAFEARPIIDASKWYKEHYAKNGVEWPGPQKNKDEITPGLAERIMKLSKTYQESTQAPRQRCASDESRTR